MATSAPAAAVSVTATYVSDTRVDVTWVRPASADVAATKWDKTRIDRFSSKFGWSTVGTVSGTATSFADGTSPDRSYYYRVHGVNNIGVAAGTLSGTVYMSPDAPSAVVAAKDGAGNIIVSWVDNSDIETSYQVEDGTTLVGSPAAGPFTHAAPDPMVTHQYRVRAAVPGPRYSAWSAYSNTVALLGVPAAPSMLSPNGVSVSLDAAITLSWVHNPVDTTPQTAYELQHRVVGSGSWTTLTGTTAQSRTVTYASQSNVEWQVRTKGAHATYSPWSALATFTATPTPTALVITPGATVTSPSVAVTWGYYHAGGNAQTGWQAEVSQGATLVASGSGTGATAAWDSPSILADGGSYSVRVRLRESSGLWSGWSVQAFTVDFPEPNASTVTADWQDGLGHVLVDITAVSGGGKPATVSHDITRSVDGGLTWEPLASGLGTVTSYLDWEAPAAGTYQYRVVAHSAVPSVIATTVSVTVADISANRGVWISGGQAFSQACRVPFDIEVSGDTGRSRVMHEFDGRTLPVEASATQVPLTLSVSGTLLRDVYAQTIDAVVGSTRLAFEALFSQPGPHLYRDSYGRVLYGTVSSVKWSREPGGKGDVSFSITRSERSTAAQAESMSGYFEEIV